MEVHGLAYEKYREINKGHIGGLQAEFTLLFRVAVGAWVLELGLVFRSG